MARERVDPRRAGAAQRKAGRPVDALLFTLLGIHMEGALALLLYVNA